VGLGRVALPKPALVSISARSSLRLSLVSSQLFILAEMLTC
jgi:hypothetical protein